MSEHQCHHGALGLACLIALWALMGSHTSAQAQPTCTGFAVGCAVHWQMPPPKGASTWRAGSYTGTIMELDGGGKKGVPNEVRLADIKSGKPFSVRMDQLNSIRCYPPGSTHIPSVTYEVSVCHLGGTVVNGPAVFSFLPWLKVQLSQEIVLSDGQTTNMWTGFVIDMGDLALGLGVNQWAKRGPATTPPPPPPPGKVMHIPDPGQSYAQAAHVVYPAVIKAYMSQNDYDTFLFDFAGGAFHAQSASELNLVADLLDAEGKMIARAMSSSGSFHFDQTLPKGRYGIIIRVMNHAGTGPYSVTLGTGAGPIYEEER